MSGDDLKALAEAVRELIEAQQRQHETPSSSLPPWLILGLTVVGALVSAIVVFYSTVNRLETTLAEVRVNQVNVLSRLAAIETWRIDTQQNRFTAQEGAALRDYVTAQNEGQDKRLQAFIDAMAARNNEFSNRITATNDRILRIEQGRTNGALPADPGRDPPARPR